MRASFLPESLSIYLEDRHLSALLSPRDLFFLLGRSGSSRRPATMLPAIATPRSTTGKGQPEQSQVMHPPERPIEHVDDWTPHDVAEWLYTRVRSGHPSLLICATLASLMPLVRVTGHQGRPCAHLYRQGHRRARAHEGH